MSQFDDRLSLIFSAAENHGLESEPDHESGDLRDVSWQVWRLLSVSQQKAFAANEEIVRIIQWFGDEDEFQEVLATLPNRKAAGETRFELLYAAISAARSHGMESGGPDSEVGDLRVILEKIWNSMSEDQKVHAMNDDTIKDLVANWGDVSSSPAR